MKNIDKTYDKVVDIIKIATPQLDNPEELSQQILDKIANVSAYKKKNKVLRMTKMISGIAASFLICVLCWGIADSYHVNNLSSLPETSINANSVLFEGKQAGQLQFHGKENISENINSLYLYVKTKQESNLKRKQVYASLSNLNK